MNIGLYGGTFDPIHHGHITVARAAAEAYQLKQVRFVVTALSPFKVGQVVSPFAHRYAMTCLALAGEKMFIPSLLEAPEDDGGPQRPNFAIDTVRTLKKQLRKADRLFYIIGADAFEKISQWHEAEALLKEVEFIVASRPQTSGRYSMAHIARALPESLRPSDAVLQASEKQQAHGTIVLRGATLHLLGNVKEPAASRDVRAAIRSGKGIKKYLAPAVAEYIQKTGLYRTDAPKSEKTPAKPVKSTGDGAAKRGTRKSAKVLEFNPRESRKKP